MRKNIPRKLPIPENTTIRYFFQTGENEYRKFYKFENKRDDFYWMSMNKGRDFRHPIQTDENNQVRLSLPENFRDLPNVNSHFSFHESGAVHKKIVTDNEVAYQHIANWNTKGQITEPKRIFSILTREVQYYDIYNKKIGKKGSRSVILRPQEPNFCSLDTRFFMEFFLTPPGTFSAPPVLINFDKEKMKLIYHSINPRFILVCRYCKITGYDWNRDLEWAFIVEPVDKSAPTS